ncbi:LytR/AlgR family response regulator transcription factor [Aureivirga sp. CE67]|uniref:LytR/AlgR family response regulator transcription factor n=1 Tax=Aureivirga sp. CE67 TaxID=1788983 RepID=UPI0018CB49E7|nr:LytTR family DNA-binding domain-containing protein [Aureivirga sp. CE67]
MIRCIIIDDEEPARLLLKDYCEKIENLEVLGLFKSPLDCIDFIEKKEINLLLLDINMPEISGIDFLKTLHKKPKVILTTAYRDYALEGFELEVSDYLLKPIEFFRFLKAVNKVKNENSTLKKENILENNIQLKSNKKIYKIPLSEIIYLKSNGEYVMYHTKNHGNILVYERIKNALDILPESYFFRIHRSFVVNTSFIKYIEGNQVVLENEKLPIGENYKTNFIEKW